VRPNPSLKRSANGRPPGPVWRYAVHFASPGLASCRRRPLSSNVRQSEKPSSALSRVSKHTSGLRCRSPPAKATPVESCVNWQAPGLAVPTRVCAHEASALGRTARRPQRRATSQRILVSPWRSCLSRILRLPRTPSPLLCSCGPRYFGPTAARGSYGTPTSRPWCANRRGACGCQPLPNPSVEARPNGGPPGPVWRYAVHCRQPGPGAPPSAPPHLER